MHFQYPWCYLQLENKCWSVAEVSLEQENSIHCNKIRVNTFTSDRGRKHFNQTIDLIAVQLATIIGGKV